MQRPARTSRSGRTSVRRVRGGAGRASSEFHLPARPNTATERGAAHAARARCARRRLMSNGVFRLFAGSTPRSGARRPSGPAVRPSRGPRRVQPVESLEARRLMAVAVLTNGNGDGTLDITVDAYGAYGGAAPPAGDALYDPIGPATPQGSTFQSA